MEEELWPKRRAGVLRELGTHAGAGHTVVLAAGGYQPVLEAFAERIGALAVGTPLEFSGGKATGRLVGAVNSGATKARRLRARVGAGELRAAYGDTSADLPMLEMSQNPVAVRPDPRLGKEALGRGWRVIENGDDG